MADDPETLFLVVLYQVDHQTIMDAFAFENREIARQVLKLLRERYGDSRVELMRAHYNWIPT